MLNQILFARDINQKDVYRSMLTLHKIYLLLYSTLCHKTTVRVVVYVCTVTYEVYLNLLRYTCNTLSNKLSLNRFKCKQTCICFYFVLYLKIIQLDKLPVRHALSFYRTKDAVKHFPVEWNGYEYSFGLGTFPTLELFLSHFEGQPMIAGENG